MSLTDKENPAVTTFRKYLQIKTEQPNVNYGQYLFLTYILFLKSNRI